MALAERCVEKEHYTEAEYFEIERTSFGRWEYVNDKIRQMSGGTTDHGATMMNIGRMLGNALVPRGCRMYSSDVKVHTGEGINTFSDISVICEPNRYYLGKGDVILSPVLVVEMLSPSTESYDRGEKFDHYQTIETLTDYLLVAQDEAKAVLYTRRADCWEMRVITGLSGSIFLPSVDVTLPLADVYALVDFDSEQV